MNEYLCRSCKEYKSADEMGHDCTIPGGIKNFCKRCIALKQRNYAANNKEAVRLKNHKWGQLHKRFKCEQIHNAPLEQKRARNRLQHLVYAGKIIKPSNCQRCGADTVKERLHGHHSDYGQRENVEWICGACHARHHHRKYA